jgi:hypothetical protein
MIFRVGLFLDIPRISGLVVPRWFLGRQGHAREDNREAARGRAHTG